jgi:hypothetical protein
MGFFNPTRFESKRTIILILVVPVILILWGGSALDTSRDKRKHTGLVLLLASGFTAFNVFSVACMQFEEEFQSLMKFNIFMLFNDYIVGIPLVMGFFIVGLLLINSDKDPAVAKNS